MFTGGSRRSEELGDEQHFEELSWEVDSQAFLFASCPLESNAPDRLHLPYSCLSCATVSFQTAKHLFSLHFLSDLHLMYFLGRSDGWMGWIGCLCAYGFFLRSGGLN